MLGAPLLGAPSLGAQAPGVGAPLRVEGSVVLPTAPDSGQERPVGGVWVTLHRVGGGSAGPLDSARTDAAGRYAIGYRRAVADSAVFFLSASYGGITYFSSPLPNAPVRGEEGDLVVYDTTSAATAVRIEGRHLIVGALDSTRRYPVVEVVEVVNDSLRTVVASETRPSWSAPLPTAVQDFRLAAGEISARALVAGDGRVSLFAPLAPGVKQMSFAYSLPPSAFPLSLPVDATIGTFEVLLEDARGTVDGALLEPADTVSIDGRTFRRFLARDVPAASVARISLEPPPPDRRLLYVAGILTSLGLLMLLALGRTVRRPSRPAVAGWNGDLGPTPEELARRIAALDATFQRRRSPSADERGEYERQRGGLKAQLTEAIARHGAER